jgi:hypothetical protein
MTVTDVNQDNTSDGRRFPGTDCALAVAAEQAIDAGIASSAVVIAHMEQWYIAHGDSPADGTGVAVNVAFLQSLGLDVQPWTGGQDVVDGFLAQGYRVEEFIWSNHYGYPYSGAGCTGHAIGLCWRNADASYHVMQPVGGTEPTYSEQLVAENSQRCGWVVRHDYRITAPNNVTPVNGTHSGGIPKMDPQAIAAVVKEAYVSAALARFAQGKGFNADALKQDAIDPQGFNAQVNAVVSGQLTLHDAVNNIYRDIAEAA